MIVVEGPTPRQQLLLFGAALAIRGGFVLWAPLELAGDALWYDVRANAVAEGMGYVNMSGNPSIAWMPGWSLLLAGLYVLFGHHPWLGFAANALLGALTCSMLALLGARLLGRAAGLAAGVAYALWPGNVYYAATLMSETFFNFALVGCLLLLAIGLDGGRVRRAPWLAGAGAAFGATAMIKAEPLVLLPALLLALHVGLREVPGRPRLHAAFLLAAALALAPWVVRNYVHFGRIIVTSGTGPANAWLGNHAGASGGQSLPTAIRQGRHLHEHPETSGYRLAWDFARSHPREEAEILWKKLVLTYGSDDAGVTLIRGLRGKRYLDAPTEQRLRDVANLYWLAVVALALFGLAGLRRWPPLARVVVLGVPACWLLVHLLFLGGARFHVPETPSIAIAAGAGAERLWNLSRRRGAPR